jgi:acetyl-CoA carboxylase biotin carboxyl carrier protein
LIDLDHLKQILDLIRDHDLSELEIEHDGLRLKIRKDAAGAAVVHSVSAAVAPPMSPPVVHSAPGGPTPSPSVSVTGPESNEEVELAVVKSPIVGTFYRSSEPEAPPFVEIGATVKKGQVLCIIEAMKLMNEIDSEYEGQVVNIYVENGQPVQYGERLFAIRTA